MDQSSNLDENPLSGQEIGLVLATDPEPHQKLTSRIADPTDSGYFHIDSLTGVLTVLDTAAFDYESNQSLSIMVSVSDDHEHSLSSTAEITAEITNAVEINHNTIILQPDGENGKDALFGKIVPDNNYGISENLHLYAWTQSGTLNVNRAAIDNQVMVDGATLPTQDFRDLDVTQRIRDYILDKGNSHGLLLKLQNENPYRMALLASSDHPIEQLRPKLEVHYTIAE